MKGNNSGADGGTNTRGFNQRHSRKHVGVSLPERARERRRDWRYVQSDLWINDKQATVILTVFRSVNFRPMNFVLLSPRAHTVSLQLDQEAL